MAENGPCYKRYSRHLLFFATLIIDRTRSPAFQAASGLFEKNIWKLLHFSFKTVSNSKPRSPRQRKFGENPTPWAMRMW